MKVADLIDSTSMERIVRELGDRLHIMLIIDVMEEDLATVADLLWSGNNAAMTALAMSGRIGLIFEPHKNGIPLDNHVEVIRLEPAYLVKDMREKWI
jgi:hypothetical protein